MSTKEELMVSNLAQFKRVLAIPGVTLTITSCVHPVTEADIPHKYLNVTRRIRKVQSNSFVLETAPGINISWGDFDKASRWSFDDDVATVRYDHMVLTYKIGKGE